MHKKSISQLDMSALVGYNCVININNADMSMNSIDRVIRSLFPLVLLGLITASPVLQAEDSVESLTQRLATSPLADKARIALKIAEKIAASETGTVDEVDRYLRLGIEAAEKTEDSELYVLTLYQAGKLKWRIDLDDQALEYYRTAAARAKDIGSEILAEIWFYTGILYFELQQFDEAISWLQRCIDRTRELQQLLLLPRCSNLLANIHNSQGRPTLAIPLLKTALELEETADNLRGIAAISNNLGLSYSKTGMPDKAIEYYLRSLVIEEQLGNIEGKVISLMNVATIYFHELHDVESAFNYLNEAIDLANQQSMEHALPVLFVNKAVFFYDEGQLEQSMQTYRSALRYAENSNDIQNKTRAHLGLGNVYLAEEKLSLATEQFRLANEGATLLNSVQEKAIALIGIGESLVLSGKIDEGIDYLTTALELAKKDELITQSVRSTIELSDAYEAKGDFKSASGYLREYILYKEQVNAERNKEAIALYKTRYETEKKEAEIELLKKENELKDVQREKDKKIQFWLYGFSIMLGITVLVILNRYFAQRSSKRIINEKNSELTVAYEQLKQVSLTDPLTGLLNRRAMSQYLNDEIVRFERKKVPFAIILVDIDYFKKLNDKFGHDCGDFALAETSKLMASLIRKQDKLCRWGGEEFLLLLPETSHEGAMVLAEKVRVAVMDNTLLFTEEAAMDKNATASTLSHDINVTVTLGVSIFDDSSLTLEQVVKKADMNLYVGKERGRNCVVG